VGDTRLSQELIVARTKLSDGPHDEHTACRSGDCNAGHACGMSKHREGFANEPGQQPGIGAIRVGMSRAAVVDRRGTPYRVETAGNIEFLFYDTSWQMSWGTTGTNPIAIADGKVVGMGSSSYPQNRNPLFPPISDAIEAYKSQMPAGG